MKRKRILSLAAVAAMMAACSNNDIPAPVVDEMTDKPITVRAGVATLKTRAGMTTDNLSNLGLSITNPTSTKYTYKNVKFEKLEGATTFTLAAEQVTPLWQNATQPVTVTAYSPYADGWTEGERTFSVQTDQTTEENVKASDLLWAHQEVDPTATPGQDDPIIYNNGALDISLGHKMCKLIVNMRKGTEPNVKDATITAMAVKGLNTQCTLNLADGTISATDTPADIQAYKETTASGYAATFEALFPPQESTFNVEVALDDYRRFRYKQESPFTFESGTAYTLNLVVGKDEIEVESLSASPWSGINENNGNLSTE